MIDLELLYGKLKNPDMDLEKQRKRWNERANEFALRGNKMMNSDVMDFIDAHIDLKDKRVLDIGFGTGRYMFEMTKRGAYVSGVELAEEMIKNAEKLFSEHGYNFDRIEVINEAWENIDIEVRRLKNSFDLVFMSNTPVVSNSESLKKALACSRGDVYIATHLKRTDDVIEALFWDYYGKSREYPKGEYELLKSILTAEGYEVDSMIVEHERDMSSEIEVVIKRYEHWLFGSESTQEQNLWLYDALSKRADEGMIKAHSVFITGLIYGTKK